MLGGLGNSTKWKLKIFAAGRPILVLADGSCPHDAAGFIRRRRRLCLRPKGKFSNG
jgi:hypothetical protein